MLGDPGCFSDCQPGRLDLLLLNDHLLLASLVKIEHLESVRDHILLDHVVELGVRPERRRTVDLQQVWRKLAVHQHVEPQNLKGHAVVEALRLTNPVLISQDRLPSDDCLHNQVFYLIHEDVCVGSVLFQDLQNRP